MSVEQLEQLPDDPALLKAMIFRRDRALELADLQIDRIEKESAIALAQRDAMLEQIKQEAAAYIEAMEQAWTG